MKRIRGKSRFMGHLSRALLGTLLSLLSSLVLDTVPSKALAANADDCTYVVDSDQELQAANNSVQPGDVVCLRSGTYRTVINPARSGTKNEGAITFQAFPGERPILFGYLDARGKSYLVLQGILFQSDGYSWVKSDENSHHIELRECEFDSSQAGSWQGVSIYGDHFIIRDSVFGDWWDGDMVYVGGSHTLIEHNDFSQARGTHSLIASKGTHVIVRRNYFRNPWDRAVTIGWKGDRKAERILVEGNLFIDNDWNQSEPHPEDPSISGALQAIKFNVSRSIFRNNIVANTNEGRDYAYSSALSLGTYKDVLHYEHLRIYHNTFYKNRNNSIAISRNTDAWYTADNVFKNNIVAESEDFAMKIVRGELAWETYRVDTNAIYDSKKEQTLYIRDGGGAQTVGQAQSNYSHVFMNNIVASPQFQLVDLFAHAEARPQDYRLADLDSFFCALSLQDESPGTDEGASLTYVIESATNATIIRVEDALYFSDGLGLIPGDSIIIGQDYPVRVTQVVDDTTLRVNRPLDVAVGDEIYLADAGVSPDVGVYGCSGDAPLPSWDDPSVIYPQADTFVSSEFPSQNYGAGTQLEVDGEPEKVTYMRFDLTPLAGTVVHSAKLRIGIVDNFYGASTAVQSVRAVTDDNWSENDMTYDTRPGLGATIATIEGGATGSYVDVDVTAFVRSKTGQVASLAIDSTGADGLQFYSKEYLIVDQRPVLIVSDEPDFTPVADAFVSSEFPSQNYGGETRLEVDGEPVKVSYMRFDLTSLAEMTVYSAKLRIKIIDHFYGASTSVQHIRTVSDDNWSENEMTYDTRPGLGDIIATIEGGAIGSYVEIDITSLVRSNVGQVVSLAIDSAGADGLQFYSKETLDVDQRPVIILADTPDLTPTADAFVSAAFPSRNYGDGTQLEVDGEPEKVAYLRFDLTPLSGMMFYSAKLRIRIIDHPHGASTSDQHVRMVSDDNWLENDLTYATRPVLGDSIAAIEGAAAGSFVEVDISSLVRSKVGQALSLAIASTGTDGMDFYSREHADADQRPVLILSDTPDFTPTADASVSAEFPSRNYGDGTQLEVDGEPEKVAYLRFDLSSLSGVAVDTAKLRIRTIDHPYGASTSVQHVKAVSDDNWSENDLAYATRPGLGDTIAAIDGAAAGSFVEVDISPLVRSKMGQLFSLAIDSTGTDGLDFYSREHADADQRPILLLTQALSFNPMADTFVSGEFPSQNYGDGTRLVVDGEPQQVAYLRFDLSSLSGVTVDSAKLRIRIIDHFYGTSTSVQHIRMVSEDNWSESDLTYDTRPGLGEAIATLEGGVAGSFVEVDLTSFVLSNVGQLFSLGIDSTGTDGLQFYSKEHVDADQRPALVLTTPEIVDRP